MLSSHEARWVPYPNAIKWVGKREEIFSPSLQSYYLLVLVARLMTAGLKGLIFPGNRVQRKPIGGDVAGTPEQFLNL